MSTRILLVALLLAVGGLALPAAADQTANETEPAPFGQQLSAAVQSTDAAASGEVSDGVFEARLERADEADREAVLRERADELDRRADRVERRLDELEAANGSEVPRGETADPANGTPHTANDSFVAGARASAVLSQLAAMRQSVNVTERRAAGVGADVPEVGRVRERSDGLRGREATATARSVAFVPPGRRPGGPPSNAGDGQRGPPAGVPGTGTSNQSAADGGPPAETPAGGDDGSNRAVGPGDRPDDLPGNSDGGGPPNGDGDGEEGRSSNGNGDGNDDGNGSGNGNVPDDPPGNGGG